MSATMSEGYVEQPSGSEGDPDSPPHNRPYHAKRPHKKSRLGCQNCKKRKVKCDEKRPSCGVCTLRGDECVYSLPILSVGSSKSKSPSASPRSRKSSPDSTALITANQGSPFIVVQEPLPIATGCDAIDMKILWHFLGHTCTSFSIEGGDSRPVEDLMRKTVMDHAFSVKFLYDSIMALSCLHASETTGNDMGDPLRLIHYQKGCFQAYSTAIHAADPKTFGALLANSLLITALSSQQFRRLDGPDLYILHWMVVWRGIGMILKRIERTSLRSTGLEQLFYRPSMDLTTSDIYIPQTLQAMLDSIQPYDSEYKHREAYSAGLRYLGTLYQNLHQGGFGAVMKLRVITWFTYLPQNFVTLITQRTPRALIILAHYAVFLKLTTRVWWLIGVGDRSVRDICTFLGPAWFDDLEVPLEAMNTNDPTELARLLLGDSTWEPRRPPTDQWDPQEEQETRQLGLVDDMGRPVYYEAEAGAIVLVNPSQPDDQPVWNASR